MYDFLTLDPHVSNGPSSICPINFIELLRGSNQITVRGALWQSIKLYKCKLPYWIISSLNSVVLFCLFCFYPSSYFSGFQYYCESSPRHSKIIKKIWSSWLFLEGKSNCRYWVLITFQAFQYVTSFNSPLNGHYLSVFLREGSGTQRGQVSAQSHRTGIWAQVCSNTSHWRLKSTVFLSLEKLTHISTAPSPLLTFLICHN